MFSPTVSAPLTLWPGASRVSSWSNWAMRASARAWKAARSSSVHQLRSVPVPSNCEPWSSKPWPTSCPMTAPMPP